MDWEAVDTFCRLRGGAIGRRKFPSAVLFWWNLQPRPHSIRPVNIQELIGQLGQSEVAIDTSISSPDQRDDK